MWIRYKANTRKHPPPRIKSINRNHFICLENLSANLKQYENINEIIRTYHEFVCIGSTNLSRGSLFGITRLGPVMPDSDRGTNFLSFPKTHV